MLVDAFTFFNELDLLKVRFQELYPVVDRFVIAESDRTFSGKPKEMVFADNKEQFEQFLDKVVYVPVQDMPLDANSNSWSRETHQRNALIRGLQDIPTDSLIMLSDVDEIPYREIVPTVQAQQSLRMQFFYYDPWSELDYLWHGTTIQRLGQITTLQHMRDARYTYPAHPSSAYHGVHLSYFGGAQRIRTKIQSMSDTQLDVPEFTDIDAIHRRVLTGKDLFDRDIRITKHLESPIPRRILECLLD